MKGMKAGVLGLLLDTILDGDDLCNSGGGGGIKAALLSALVVSDDIDEELMEFVVNVDGTARLESITPFRSRVLSG